MITALTPAWSSAVGAPERPRGGTELESMRARIGHEVAAGHCRDCDGFLAVQARSGASGLTAAMVGVQPAGGTRSAPAGDRVSISAAGRAAASRGAEDASTRSRATHEVERALDAEAVDPVTRRGGAPRRAEGAGVPSGPDEARTPRAGGSSDDDLALAELRQLAALQARDREVRAHEQAHKAVAGPHGGAMSFEYQTGPDGRKYAIGGEVAVDLSTVRGDPQATIDKMEQVRRAALAPAEPSATDRAVAARASAQAEQARAELRTERTEAEDEPEVAGTRAGSSRAASGPATERADATPPEGPRTPGPAARAATAAAAQLEAASRFTRGAGARIDLVI